VLGLATINPWLQPPKVYTHPLQRRGEPFDRFTRNLAIEECHRAIGELGLHGVKMHPREHGYPVNDATVRQLLGELVQVQREVKRRLLIAITPAKPSWTFAPTSRIFSSSWFTPATSGAAKLWRAPSVLSTMCFLI
jgi:hypothetical protein